MTKNHQKPHTSRPFHIGVLSLRIGPASFRFKVAFEFGHSFDGEDLELEVKMGFGTSQLPAKPDPEIKATVDLFRGGNAANFYNVFTCSYSCEFRCGQ